MKTLPGLIIGVPLAIFTARAMQYLFVGVSPTDTFTLSTSLLFLVTVAIIASLVPAWRASRVDPLVALHNESLPLLNEVCARVEGNSETCDFDVETI